MATSSGWFRPLLFTTLLLLATSCGSGDATDSSFAVRDSAGVRIAESTAPAWGEGERWQVDDAPLLDIGDEAAGLTHVLSEVGGVTRLADGRIVLADGGTYEVRFYRADGGFLTAVGREGEGPGEYRSFGLLRRLPGDSILVSDPHLDRLTVLRADGSLARTAQLSPRDFSPTVVLADGSLLARTGFSFGRDTEAGVRQDSVTVARFGLDGVLRDTVGRFLGATNFVFHDGERTMAGELLLGSAPSYAARGEHFLFVPGDVHAFEVRDAQGRTVEIVRARRPLERVTDAHRERLLAPMPDEDQSMAAFWRRYLGAMPLPATFPTYTGALADEQGHAWLREYSFPADTLPEVWQVFDREGQWLGPVPLPLGMELKFVDEDAVVGLWRDEYDVEHVRVHRLRRSVRGEANKTLPARRGTF